MISNANFEITKAHLLLHPYPLPLSSRLGMQQK